MAASFFERRKILLFQSQPQKEPPWFDIIRTHSGRPWFLWPIICHCFRQLLESGNFQYQVSSPIQIKMARVIPGITKSPHKNGLCIILSQKNIKNTADGRNPAPLGRWFIQLQSHYLQCVLVISSYQLVQDFLHPQYLVGGFNPSEKYQSGRDYYSQHMEK